MSPRKNKPPLTPQNSFVISEPRYIEPKESVSITKISIFTPRKSGGDYSDEQFNHAIYELEVANNMELKNEPRK